MGDFGAAIAECDEVLERFGNNDESALQCWVAVTLINKGKARENLGNFERAIAAYDEVVKRFGKTNDTNLQVIVSNALLDKGNSLIKHGEFNRAIAPCDEIIHRFGDINTPVIQEQVAGALFCKGIAFGKLGDFMRAIVAYDEVIERYVDNNAPDIQRWVITALSEKSMHKTQIGSADEALRTCGELERSLVNFNGEMKPWIVWRTLCARTKALLLKENLKDAMDVFGSAYAALPANTEFTTHEMVKLIPDLIAAGASSQELVEILTSDETKSGALAPLIVALRQLVGEKVRAPAEVLEVAADIRERIEEKAAKGVYGVPRLLE